MADSAASTQGRQAAAAADLNMKGAVKNCHTCSLTDSRHFGLVVSRSGQHAPRLHAWAHRRGSKCNEPDLGCRVDDCCPKGCQRCQTAASAHAGAQDTLRVVPTGQAGDQLQQRRGAAQTYLQCLDALCLAAELDGVTVANSHPTAVVMQPIDGPPSAAVCRWLSAVPASSCPAPRGSQAAASAPAALQEQRVCSSNVDVCLCQPAA